MQVVHNVIRNISGVNSTKGVFIEDSASTDPSIGITVDGNDIHDVSSANKGAYGVLVNNGGGNTSNDYLVIRRNRVSALSGGWVHGVGLEADTPFATVSENTFRDFTSPGPDKLAVWFENENVSFSTATVTGNVFDFVEASGVYGIAVQFAMGEPVDGTCNYWGSATGPSGAGEGRGGAREPAGDVRSLVQNASGREVREQDSLGTRAPGASRSDRHVGAVPPGVGQSQRVVVFRMDVSDFRRWPEVGAGNSYPSASR